MDFQHIIFKLKEYWAEKGCVIQEPYDGEVGAGAQVSYRINPLWEVHAYVEYERLLGDAANNPLVTLRGSKNQTTVGIGASYAFDFRIR